MKGKQLEQALEHDAAQKESARQTASVVDIGSGSPVSSVAMDAQETLRMLETKNALLAKSVVMQLVDVARTFAGLSLATGPKRKPQAISDKPSQDPRLDVEMPIPEQSLKMLLVAEKAIALARSVDVLGDRAVVRTSGVTDTSEVSDVERNEK